jgi:hypothetical protein
LFAEAQKAVEAEDAAAKEEEEEDEEEEPEDDFNAAWEVLDLARALYENLKDTDDEIKLKLADCYICLGDVSLETGMNSSVYTRTFSKSVFRKIRECSFRLRARPCSQNGTSTAFLKTTC